MVAILPVEQQLATHSVVDTELALLFERVLPLLVQIRGGNGNGAGTIWRADGLIVTNAHVVGQRATVQITLHDRRHFEGRVLTSDSTRDLALVEIDANDLPAPHIGDSAGMLPGQFVLAIGHPGGQINTLTAGISVAAGHTVHNGETKTSDLVRVDAQIAPGSSGGPLVGSDGRVLGIATRVSGRLSMAIPAATVERFIAELLPANAQVYLGVDGVIANVRNDSPSAGFVLTRVIDGAAAAQAGLLIGDVIQSIGGEPIVDQASIPTALLRAQAGTAIKIGVLRGGLPRTIMIVPGERISNAPGRSY